MHVLGYRVPPAVAAAAIVGVVVALAVAIPLRRRIGLGRALGWGSILWLAVTIGAVTLSPSDSEGAAAGCTLNTSRLFTNWMTDDARLLNTLLFIPLAALVPVAVKRPARVMSTMLLLVASPLAVELVQSTNLVGRSCDGADVADNWTGIAAGGAVGLLARTALNRRHRPDLSDPQP